MSTNDIPGVSHARLVAGAAQLDITPPLGIDLMGYFNVRRADDVLDPLFARAVFLSDGRTEVAVVSCDVCMLVEHTVRQIRQTASELCGIPAPNILVSATHTHTGPATREVLPGQVDQAYMDLLARKAASAVALAKRRTVPASVWAARGQEHTLAFNRRYRMRDGSVRTNPGKANPDVVAAVGPVDPDFLVLTLKDETARPIAAIVNYSNHVDTIGGCAISADFPGVMSREVAEELGGAPVLFLQSAAGNVNHINVRDPSPQGGPGEAERIGSTLASAVYAAVDESRPIGGDLAVMSCNLELAVRLPTADMLQWAKDVTGREQEAGTDVTAGDLAKGNPVIDLFYAQGMLYLHSSGAKTETLELQGIAIGEAALVGVPGEPFVEIGLRVKEASPFAFPGVVALANGASGYIPVVEAFEQGGYETRLARSSKLEERAAEKVVAAAISIFDGLSRNSSRKM